MKKMIISILIVFLLICGYNNAYAIIDIPSEDNFEKIYDYAGVFTFSEKEELNNKMKEFINEYNLDIAIVTINYNPKESAKAYAEYFYEYSNLGIGSNYDGLMLLIDFDNENSYIATCGKGKNIYSDSNLDKILDDMYDGKTPFSDSYGAAINFVDGANYYAYSNVVSNKILKILFALGIPFIITIIIIAVQCGKHKTIKKQIAAKEYLKKDSVNITVSDDKFISTFTSKIKIESSSSRSHGGGGGHSFGGRGR